MSASSVVGSVVMCFECCWKFLNKVNIKKGLNVVMFPSPSLPLPQVE